MIRICEIDIGNPKTRNSRNWFRYETFYYLWVKGNSTWGERGTIFLCWLFHLPHHHHHHHVRHIAANYWSGLGEPRKSTFFLRGKNSTAFSQIPKSSTHASEHDVIHLPRPISYLRILFWHLWMTHPPRARVNICVNVAPN